MGLWRAGQALGTIRRAEHRAACGAAQRVLAGGLAFGAVELLAIGSMLGCGSGVRCLRLRRVRRCRARSAVWHTGGRIGLGLAKWGSGASFGVAVHRVSSYFFLHILR